MSEVALSSAAGLRRLVGLPQAGSRACRSLFGPVDHEEIRRELRGRLLELAEEARERWGFDFQAETPVAASRLRWEPMCDAAVPAFYREIPSRQGAEPVCSAGDGTKAGAEQGSQCLEAAPAEQVNQGNGAQSGEGQQEGGPVSGGTTHDVTDFFPKRKRGAFSEGPCELLPTACAAPREQTPRKKRLR